NPAKPQYAPGTPARASRGKAPTRSRAARKADRRSAGVGTVHVPVPADRSDPVPVVPGHQAEAADHTLAALLISVEDVHRQGFPGLDRVTRGGEVGSAGLAEGPLPEAHAAGRDVDVSGQAPELSGVRVRRVEASFGIEHPAVQDGHATSHVAQRDGHVDRLVGDLATAPPPGGRTQWLSANPTLSGASSRLDGVRTGRMPASSARSAV